MDTGYEAKFDFPARAAAPERPYLLATVPRSGSTYLSHVLWRTGCLGAPLEYLNFDPAGPYGHASASPVAQRRDRTAHAISYARAILSGVWRQEQEHAGLAEPDYSALAIERASRMIDEQEAAWQAMFADLTLTPLTLWYEDVVADPGAAAAEVADHLGVPLEPGREVGIPEIARQSQDGARAWASKHGGD